MVKQISDNEIYLLLKYIKSVLWRAAKPLSYIQDARCLNVNVSNFRRNYKECEEQHRSYYGIFHPKLAMKTQTRTVNTSPLFI